MSVQLTEVKQEALRIRREIEAISTVLWANASGLELSELSSRNIERRLVLLVAQVPEDKRKEAFRAARQAAHVYGETSDVLHGRTRGSRFGSIQVTEWGQDLIRIRSLMEGR